MIDYEDFERLDIRIGKILLAEAVEGSEKLLRLEVDLGEENTRQIIAGIAEFFLEPEALIGKEVPVLTNLEPKTMMGLESEGMILAVGGREAFSLLVPEEEVPPGSAIR